MLRKQYIYPVVVLLLTLFAGCSDLRETEAGGKEIRLYGKVGGVLTQTKAGGSLSGKDYGTLELGMARVDTPKSSALPDFSTASVLKAEMKSDGSAVTNDLIDFTDSYQTFKNSTNWVNYASWYPYKPLENGKVTFEMDGNTDVLYGSIVKGRENSPFDPVVFNHALVKFKVWIYALVPQNPLTGEMMYDPDAVWGKVTSLTIGNVPETYSLLLPTSSEKDYRFEPTEPTEPSAVKSFDMILPFGKGTMVPNDFPLSIDDKKAVAEFMIPPTSMLSLKVCSTQMTDGQELSIEKTFEAGCHYDIILRFSDYGLINADVKAGEWGHENVYADRLAGNVFYDLSENETANCYVVSSANYNYCFNATVKGNGAEGVVDGADVALAPHRVDVLWATEGVLSENGSPGFLLMNEKYISEGRVLFTVIGDSNQENKVLQKEGNVLLGVYDEADNLLWTWHIWMCDTPQRQGYKNGFSVHDRDLGAIEYSPFAAKDDQAAIDGLYYQWGRPTPFLFEKRTDVAMRGGLHIDNTEGVPLAERIVHPEKFYGSRLEEAALPHLWGWRSVKDEYLKTIYDPCPPGYRVPSNRLWRELTLAHEPHIGQTVSGVTNNHAIHFKVDAYSDIFYPVSGYYHNNKGYLWNEGYSDVNYDMEGAAYMWAATYNADVQNPYNLKYERLNATTVGKFTVASSLHSYSALPVRCVSRKSTPHVEDLSAFQTANSYIVPAPGYYKFNAGVRGNGISRLVSPGTSDFIDVSEGLATDISGTIVKVKYLWWQEENGKDMPTGGGVPVVLDNDGMVNDGYVMFHIDEFRKGNLVLAAYDESESVILWTWHLWLTDTPKQMKSHNFTVMDRNLGATFAPKDDSEAQGANFAGSVGLYYQWSRKDPFVRPGDGWYLFNGSGWTKTTKLHSMTDEKEQKTIPNSVQNPMRFHQSKDILGNIPTGTLNIGSWDKDYNDIENQCFSTFRIPDSRTSVWGYSSAAGLGKTTTKTMYDPCPPGYCVAFYTVWTNDGQNYYTNLDSGYKTFPFSGNDKMISGYGIFVEADKTFDRTWYPFSGYIDSRGAKQLYKTEGRFHSSTPAGNGSRSLYYTHWYTGQAVDYNYWGISSSFAYPVRCQKQ